MEDKNKNIQNEINEIDDENEDNEVEEVVDESGKKTYVKRLFGSGVKNRTEEKQAQCCLCKHYYKRLNTQHLIQIHKMSLEDLEKTNPEMVRYFTDSNYAIENSAYALAHKAEVKEVKKASDGVELVETEKAFSAILDEICDQTGHNRKDQNFVETPKRVAKAYREMLSGMYNTQEQIDKVLSTNFPTEYPGMVVQTDIRTFSLCPHHSLVISNKIHIGYMPGDSAVGLSKLARVADILSRRYVMQEDLTNDIMKALWNGLKPKGVAVIVEGVHSCMSVRGACQSSAVTTTMAVEGCFRYDPNAKSEFLFHVQNSKK